MSKGRILRACAVVAVLGAALTSAAHEPDGRIVIRYDWLDAKAGESPDPKLRLMLTAVVDVSELTLSARVPQGVGLAVRAAGHSATPWPDDGIPIGALAAGRSIVFELEVEKPSKGGGIVGFALRGVVGGVPIVEGVGVPVGIPGTEPKLRNGALEFPAEQGNPAP